MRVILPLALGIVFELAAPIFAAGPQVNQQAIDDVRGGRCRVARAAWWGFQPEESTKALQAAINSGAEKVIVEKMQSPWIVDRIKLAGNQELVFEKGVVVLAKKGAFHGPGDSLFQRRRQVEHQTHRLRRPARRLADAPRRLCQPGI